MSASSQASHTRTDAMSDCTVLSRKTPLMHRQRRCGCSKGSSIGFRHVFNHERPHEGLNNETPGSLYQPSTKIFPRSIAEYVYPNGFVTRRVNNSGDISWHKGRVFISEVFRFEELGLRKWKMVSTRCFSARLRSESSTWRLCAFDLRRW
jgi:hypothetical protein